MRRIQSVKRILRRRAWGNAPLAHVESGAGGGTLPDRAVRYLIENFNRWYGYKRLFEFKKKYGPRWRGRYPGYVSAAELTLVLFGARRAGLLRSAQV